MVTWILILFAHVGPMGDGNSNALDHIGGWKSQAECTAAGNAAKDLGNGTTKIIKFACVKKTN